MIDDTLRHVIRTSKFRKDVRKAGKQGKDLNLADEVISMLANDIPLPLKHCDHALTGNWAGFRECHIAPDWLLIYRKTDDGELLLVLVRLASHSALNF